MDGLLLFGKYAFPPNFLRYCGPQDNKMFFEILRDYSIEKSDSKKRPSKEFKHLLLQFEGAVPYLKLIAEENNIKDIFDARVVEAYWLGNGLLRKVEPGSLYFHIEERFRKKVNPADWRLIKSPPAMSRAKPFHNYHVFSIFSKAGLMRSGEKKAILKTMDNCRISWGRVKDFFADENLNNAIGNVLVECWPLEFDKLGELQLGKKAVKNFYLLDDSIKKGDEVSLHWGFVCDKLSPRQKNNLNYWTNYHIKVFNEQRK